MKEQEKVYELAASIAKEWGENAEQNIKEVVNNVLDGNLEDIVLIATGFEKSHVYGNKRSWKVDHCNGRSGNSPITEIIKDAIGDRFRELAGRMELSDDQKNAIKKEMQNLYLSEYKSELAKLVKYNARQHAQQFLKKSIGDALSGAAEAVRLRLMETNK